MELQKHILKNDMSTGTTAQPAAQTAFAPFQTENVSLIVMLVQRFWLRSSFKTIQQMADFKDKRLTHFQTQLCVVQ